MCYKGAWLNDNMGVAKTVYGRGRGYVGVVKGQRGVVNWVVYKVGVLTCF